jgi:hypothetical protein
MTSSYPQFITALERLEEHDVCYEVLEALDTLLVYCYNLYSRPDETKFHYISSINIHFQERLGHLPGATDAMSAIGYRKAENVYQYDDSLLKEDSIESTKMLLTKMIQHLEKRRNLVRS